jgi:hypothetical protein
VAELLAKGIGERSKGDSEFGELVELIGGDCRGKERKNDNGLRLNTSRLGSSASPAHA